MRLPVVLAIFVTVALASAAPASAASVCESGGVAIFLAADVASGCPGAANATGEVNALTVSADAAGNVVFTDPSNPITDADGSGGCSVSGNRATCPAPGGFRFDLGDGNDSASIGAVASGGNVSTGGAGNDRLTGGALADALDGGPGNDVVDGGAGDDSLFGGPGPTSGTDSDVLNGGDGDDHAWYPRTHNVSVTLDDAANDGESGEGDNVHADVEDLTTGSGSDVLVGSGARNVLDGGAGADALSGGAGDDLLLDSGGDSAADRLDGGAGDDALAGGAGPDTYLGGDGEDTVTDYAGRASSVHVTLDDTADDGAAGEGDNVGSDIEDVIGGTAADTLVGNAADNELDGGGGDDTIDGGDGNDGLSGGAGRDTIDGGGGRDDLEGGSGADRLTTRDGQTDRAGCGGGTDAVQAEARDDVAGDCENVSIAAPTPITIGKVQVTRAGFVVVRVTCPSVERSCSGVVIVKTLRRIAKRFIQLGRVGYRLRGGQGRAIRGRIARGDRKPLRRAKRVKVRAIVTNVNSDTGASTNATKVVTVTTRGL